MPNYSGSITLSKIFDGQQGTDGNSYNLVFNKQKVIKYKVKDGSNNYFTRFAPSRLIFYATKRDGNNTPVKLSDNDYDFTFAMLDMLGSDDTSSLEELDKTSPYFQAFKPFLFYDNDDSSVPANWVFEIQQFWDTYILSSNDSDYKIIVKYATTNGGTPQDWGAIISGSIYAGVYFPQKISDGDEIQYSSPSSASDYHWYLLGNKTAGQDDPTDTISGGIKQLLQKLGRVMGQDDAIYIFKLKSPEAAPQEWGTFPLVQQWATTESLASFALNADSINMAVDNAKLRFDSDGLHVVNGGLDITRVYEDGRESEKVFWVDDNDDGDLHIKGRLEAATGTFAGELSAATGSFSGNLDAAGGTFSGKLEAAEGSFAGELLAATGTFQEGHIGKAYIGQETSNYIVLDEKSGIVHYDAENENASNFSISLDGSVIAKRITLDEGRIGDLTFNNSTIRGGDSWYINSTDAVFNNITAAGKITTAIFEQQKLQLCGGTFLFKDAYRINDIEIQAGAASFTPVFRDSIQPNSFNLYMITNENRSVQFYATPTDGGSWTIHGSVQYGIYNLVLDLGSISGGKTDDWLIAINSTATDLTASGLPQNSVSLSCIESSGSSYKIVPKIILGKIPAQTISTAIQQDTYGLYAESAYLTGTLTTQYSSDSGVGYAGVNTLSGARFNKKVAGLTDDNSRIVFWAGSNGLTDDAIQNSVFQVSENGTLYASQGYFEGSILSKATIEASTLRTVKIEGAGAGPALSISDCQTGIVFTGTRNNIEQNVFSLTSDGIESSVPLIFTGTMGFNIINARASMDRLIIVDNQNQSGTIVINPLSLDFYSRYKSDSALVNDYTHGDYRLQASSNGLAIYDTEKRVNFDKDKASIYSGLDIQDNLSFGNIDKEEYTAQYRKATETDASGTSYLIGLDLYITEIEVG